MNKRNIIIVVLNIIVVLSLILWTKSEQKKTAYVDLGKVFDEFELSKNYNRKVEDYHNKAKTILDSMEVEVNMFAKLLSIKKTPENTALFESKKERYFLKRDEFDQSYQKQTEDYSVLVMKQLNQYVKEFGIENGYTYIYGADGNGTIMYANENENITDDFVKYINSKYSGTN